MLPELVEIISQSIESVRSRRCDGGPTSVQAFSSGARSAMSVSQMLLGPPWHTNTGGPSPRCSYRMAIPSAVRKVPIAGASHADRQVISDHAVDRAS